MRVSLNNSPNNFEQHIEEPEFSSKVDIKLTSHDKFTPRHPSELNPSKRVTIYKNSIVKRTTEALQEDQQNTINHLNNA